MNGVMVNEERGVAVRTSQTEMMISRQSTHFYDAAFCHGQISVLITSTLSFPYQFWHII